MNDSSMTAGLSPLTFLPRIRKVWWPLLLGVWLVLLVVCGEWAAQAELRNLVVEADANLEMQSLSLRGVTQRFKHLPFTSGQKDDISALLQAPTSPGLTHKANQYLHAINRRVDAQALYLMNAAGRCLAASNAGEAGSFVGDDYAFRSYFQQARAGGIGFEYAVGTTSCTPGLYYASPVRVGDDVLGVMAIKVTLSEIEKSWVQATNPLFLLDRHGVVILSTLPNFLYTTTHALNDNQLREMEASRPYGKGKCARDSLLKPAPWQSRSQAKTGYQIVTTSLQGHASTFLVRQLVLPEFDWTLMATANLASVENARWIAIALVFLFSLALLFGTLYWRQREKRVIDLRRARAELEIRVADRTRELAERDAFRKAMEDALLVGMRARDLDGRVTYVNPALCDITGYRAEEMLGGMPPYIYWHPEDIEQHWSDNKNAMRGPASITGFETRFRHKQGHDVFVMITNAPLINTEGQQSGWMSSVVDITTQKQMEAHQRLQDEHLRQVQRRSVMEEMASSLAHEINQPLIAIGASNEAAKLFAAQGNLPMLHSSLERIALQKQRAANIIKTIRDHTRVQTKGSELCNINDIVGSVALFLRAEVKQRSARLVVRQTPYATEVQGDRVLLEQVLVNLVMNSLQAMQNNPVRERVVDVETGVRDGFVFVKVDDMGSGISAEVGQQLFKSFFTTKPDGLGMGLNICRTIVENHGGQLTYENRHTRGVAFSFTLPRQL
jgi:PAS domain S-box-containing protein